MKRIALALLLALGIGGGTVAGTAAQAQPRDSMRRAACAKLQLTEEQQKQMREIRRAVAREMIDLRAAMQKKQLDLREMTADPSAADRAKLEGTLKEMADLRIKQALLLFDTDQRIMKLLTPEQRKTYTQMKAQRRQAMRGFMQNRQGMRGQGRMRGQGEMRMRGGMRGGCGMGAPGMGAPGMRGGCGMGAPGMGMMEPGMGAPPAPPAPDMP